MGYGDRLEERGILNNSALFGSEASKVIRQVIKRNNAVGTIIGYYDDEYSIISVSDYLLSNLGYTEEEFMHFTKGSLLNIFYGENRHFLEPNRFSNISGMGEGEMLTKDGTPVTVKIIKDDSKDINGRPLWILSVRVDWDHENITLISGAIKSGLWYFDCDEENNIQEVNWSHAFRRILGYNDIYDFPNKLSSWQSLLHPADEKKTMELLHNAMKDKSNETKFSAEYRLKMQDGSYRWFCSNAEMVRRVDGSVRRITGIFSDIDEEKKKSIQLKKLEAFYKTFTRMNLCEYYVDLYDNIFDFLNVRPALMPIISNSTSWDELVDRFVEHHVSQEYKQSVKSFYNRENIKKTISAENSELSLECTIDINGGKRWIRNVILRSDSDDKGVYVFFRDITDIKINRV